MQGHKASANNTRRYGRKQHLTIIGGSAYTLAQGDAVSNGSMLRCALHGPDKLDICVTVMQGCGITFLSAYACKLSAAVLHACCCMCHKCQILALASTRAPHNYTADTPPPTTHTHTLATPAMHAAGSTRKLPPHMLT